MRAPTYDDTTIALEIDGEYVEAEIVKDELPTFPKEEGIVETLYMRAQEQRADRIEDQQYRWGEPRNK